MRNSFEEYYGLSEEDASLAVEKCREYFGITELYENTVYCGMENVTARYIVANANVAGGSQKGA